MFIFGTRPEAIKLAPVILEFKKKLTINTYVCVTGQHNEMLKVALEDFDIIPDINLNVMQLDQTLAALSARLLDLLNPVLKKYSLDWILVHGDTTSAFIGALSGFYNRISVAHIESGLRTKDISSPFPEELNRQMIARIADVHFCPTLTASNNLLNEGVCEKKIQITGNTVVDAVLWMQAKLLGDPAFSRMIFENLNYKLGLNIMNIDYILITGHRRENLGDGFKSICSAIIRLANLYPNISFIYPVHLNPNVKEVVTDLLKNIDNVHLIDPVNYSEFIALLGGCKLVLTDSGGIQEEAPSFRKPVLIMRNNTERQESLQEGFSQLVGTEENSICSAVINVLESNENKCIPTSSLNPYGDGSAASKICNFLMNQ